MKKYLFILLIFTACNKAEILEEIPTTKSPERPFVIIEVDETVDIIEDDIFIQF